MLCVCRNPVFFMLSSLQFVVHVVFVLVYICMSQLRIKVIVSFIENFSHIYLFGIGYLFLCDSGIRMMTSWSQLYLPKNLEDLTKHVQCMAAAVGNARWCNDHYRCLQECLTCAEIFWLVIHRLLPLCIVQEETQRLQRDYRLKKKGVLEVLSAIFPSSSCCIITLFTDLQFY